MMPLIQDYLRQFAVLGTSWREKYKTDLFFRTTIHVVMLQGALVLLSILAFSVALQYPGRQWYIFGSVAIIGTIAGMVLARLTLKPARDTLYYQQLFISNIAHELRTPLSTIKTSTEVALLEDNLPHMLRRMLLEIVGELDRVSEIINNLLSLNTLNRPERMQFGNTDLGPIIDTVVKRHSGLARERGIEITVRKDNFRIAWGNGSGLEQIFTNLLKNAISYTPRDAHGAITVSVRPDYHGMIQLVIVDNGIGIAQEDLFHIFEPFYRADTSRVRKIRKSGSGLGLTIVNEIVRVHHGRINIQSAPRKGTTVTVSLPSGTPLEEISSETPHTSGHGQSEVSVDFSKGISSPGPQGAMQNGRVPNS